MSTREIKRAQETWTEHAQWILDSHWPPHGSLRLHGIPKSDEERNPRTRLVHRGPRSILVRITGACFLEISGEKSGCGPGSAETRLSGARPKNGSTPSGGTSPPALEPPCWMRTTATPGFWRVMHVPPSLTEAGYDARSLNQYFLLRARYAESNESTGDAQPINGHDAYMFFRLRRSVPEYIHAL